LCWQVWSVHVDSGGCRLLQGLLGLDGCEGPSASTLSVEAALVSPV